MLGVVDVVLRADGEAQQGEQRNAMRVVVQRHFLEDERANQIPTDREGDGDGDEGPYGCLQVPRSAHVLEDQIFIL